MLITSWLPVLDFPDFDHAGVYTTSMRILLRDHYAISGGRQHKEVELTTLDELESQLLNAGEGSPAFLITLVSYTAAGRPYEYRKMLVRGDRAKYYADFEEPEPLV
jgi:DNA-binding GntR family transcriptional regulator